MFYLMSEFGFRVVLTRVRYIMKFKFNVGGMLKVVQGINLSHIGEAFE